MKRAIARTKTRIFVIIVSIKLNSNYLTFQLYRYFAISLSYESEFRKGIEKFQSRRSKRKRKNIFTLASRPYSDPFTIEIFVAIRRCPTSAKIYSVPRLLSRATRNYVLLCRVPGVLPGPRICHESTITKDRDIRPVFNNRFVCTVTVTMIGKIEDKRIVSRLAHLSRDFDSIPLFERFDHRASFRAWLLSVFSGCGIRVEERWFPLAVYRSK